MIAVLNKSTRVSSADIATATRACAHQLRYDAAPIWGRAPRGVVYYASEDHVPPGAWKLVVFDNADQAGVLGWHSEGPDGLPFGRVFCGPVLDNGGDALSKKLSVASVLSHEVLEAFVDPSVNLTADDYAGGTWALEVGDPVESDSYVVPVKLRDGTTTNVTVSNFVYPQWFDPQTPHGERVDWLGKAAGPFKLAPGGYAIKNGQAVWGEKYPGWRRLQKEAEFLRARTLRVARSTDAHALDVAADEDGPPIGRSARRVRQVVPV